MKLQLSRLFAVLITVSMVIVSCDNKNTEPIEEVFIALTLPTNSFNLESFKSTAMLDIPLDERIVEEDFYLELSGKVVTGKQIIELDENGNVVGVQLSKNIFDETGLDCDFLVTYSQMIDEEFDGFKTTEDVGACTKACNDPSVKRPGWCKAGCVAEVVVKIALVVAAFLT